MTTVKLIGLMVGLAHLARVACAQPGGQWEPVCHVSLRNTNNDLELAHHACRAGDLAFLACDAAGLRMFNVSNTCPPQERGFYAPRNLGRALDVAARGSNVLVAFEYGGAHLLQVSNDLIPHLIEVIQGPGEPGAATSVAFAGSLALLTAGIETVHLFGLGETNPSPRKATYCTGPPGSSYTYLVRAFDSSLAYCGCSRIGVGHEVQIVDLSRPTAPAWLGSMRTAGPCVEISRQGSCVYLMDGRAKLYIYDLTDPTHPVPCSTNSFQGVGTGLWTDEQYIYVTASLSGFVVLGNCPQTPPPICGFPLNDARTVYAAAGLAWVADQESLHLFKSTSVAPRPPLFIHSITNATLGSTNDQCGWHISFTNQVTTAPKTYILQAAHTLGDGPPTSPDGPAAWPPIPWVNIASNRASLKSVMTLVDPAQGPRRFYRVVEAE